MAKSNMQCNLLWLAIAVLCSGELAFAQEEASCYGPGSIAASVILTFVCTAVLAVILYFLWKRYKQKKGKTYISDPNLFAGVHGRRNNADRKGAIISLVS